MLGYKPPGHGMKGKQEKITTDVELSDMRLTRRKKDAVALKCRPFCTVTIFLLVLVVALVA